MGPTIIGQKVRERFSDAALRYDALTDVHKEVGRRLLERVRNVGSLLPLLDIGMGTGWFTQRLAEVFPGATVVGMDFASGMVSRAREREGAFKIVQGSACALPFREGAFGMITSNLAYQWVDDLPRAFAHCRSCLSENGQMHLTMFGHGTLRELFAALDASVGENGLIVRRLADKMQAAAALRNAGFRTVRVETEYRTAHFPDMMALVKWIRDIGANALPRDVYVGRDLFQKANAYYNEHFQGPSGVYATFEVIWVEATR